MALTSFSQHGEDLQIAYYLGRRENLTYVDIGSLWPVELSNSYFFYRRGGSGLCIEPNPEMRARFAAERPRDVFFSGGVGNGSESRAEYAMYDNPVFNTISPERKDALLQQQAKRGRELVDTISIEMSTVNAVAMDTGFVDRVEGQVDFVSIDAAGSEIAVLQGFDFQLLRPRLVVIDSSTLVREDDIPTLLSDRGFAMVGYTKSCQYFMAG